MASSQYSEKIQQREHTSSEILSSFKNALSKKNCEQTSEFNLKNDKDTKNMTNEKDSCENLCSYFKSIPTFDIGLINVKEIFDTPQKESGEHVQQNHLNTSIARQESTNIEQFKNRNKSAISKINANNCFGNRKSSLKNQTSDNKHTKYKDFIKKYVQKDDKMNKAMYLQGKNFDGIVKRLETVENDASLLKGTTKDVIKNYDKFYINKDIKSACFDYNINEKSCNELINKFKQTPKKINTTDWKKKDLIKFDFDENSKNILEDFQNIFIQNIQSQPEGDYFCFYNIEEIEKLMKHVSILRNNTYCILKIIEKYQKDGRKAIHIKRTREGYYKNIEPKLIL